MGLTGSTGTECFREPDLRLLGKKLRMEHRKRYPNYREFNPEDSVASVAGPRLLGDSPLPCVASVGPPLPSGPLAVSS